MRKRGRERKGEKGRGEEGRRGEGEIKVNILKTHQ
jgi:hypothetical protein